VVADALSRIPPIGQINSIASTQHSDESLGKELIPSMEVPINDFRNQIFLHKAEMTDFKFSIPFPTFTDDRRNNVENPTIISELLQKF